MAHVLMGIDKIPDQQGYLVISSDGAVLASAGDLENDEKLAQHIHSMVHTASKIPLSKDNSLFYRRLTITYKDFNLLVTISNQKIYAVKRPTNRAD